MVTKGLKAIGPVIFKLCSGFGPIRVALHWAIQIKATKLCCCNIIVMVVSKSFVEQGLVCFSVSVLYAFTIERVNATGHGHAVSK